MSDLTTPGTHAERPEELLRNHLDADGRLTVWPSRRKVQLAALEYLASKFQPGAEYTEAQVNEVILRHHAFEDIALLRRELVEAHGLERTRDGSRYWKGSPTP